MQSVNRKAVQRKWSDDDLKLLKKLFPIKQTKEVAEILERPMHSVIRKAYILDIKKKSFFSLLTSN